MAFEEVVLVVVTFTVYDDILIVLFYKAEMDKRKLLRTLGSIGLFRNYLEMSNFIHRRQHNLNLRIDEIF